MARGILGDDGPSLFMFIAVILIWGTIQRWASNAGDKLGAAKDSLADKLEIGKNSASIWQAQTTAQISQMETMVKSIAVPYSKLPHPPNFYKQTADAMWKEMTSTINIDEWAIVEMVRVFSKDELLAVAKAFGVREVSDWKNLGLTTAWTGTIFDAMTIAFDGYFKESERLAMHRIWAKTKMW